MKRPENLAFIALAAASLACSIFLGGPTLPDPPILGSPDALRQLQADIQSAISNSLADGTLRLSITQEQLTAFLASRLAARPDPLISEPQVVLGEQEMMIHGRAHSWMFEANIAVAVEFTVDDTGRPQISISHAELGPMPMPPALKEAVTAALDEAFTGYVGPVATGFRLESIDISGGVMTLTGRMR